MKRMYFVLFLAALVLIAGCTQTIGNGTQGNQQTSGGASAAGQGTQTTSSGGQEQQTSAATNINIEIKNFAFSPQAITIKKGSTVTWEQMDSAPHTATSTSSPSGAAFDSGTLNKGASWSHTFNTAGTYEYYCAIHPNMKGKIIVE
ncbi:MAG: cupredoxin family copper-binding protein [Candidatus Woesearchaeota archaeon]|nr:cupredoxin family copper-binding protein [Candidatus Woesearchaeota archaeon]